MKLIILVIFIIGELLSGLVIMGLLNFLFWAFGLAITISFLQALAISLVLTFIGTLFRGGKK